MHGTVMYMRVQQYMSAEMCHDFAKKELHWLHDML